MSSQAVKAWVKKGGGGEALLNKDLVADAEVPLSVLGDDDKEAGTSGDEMPRGYGCSLDIANVVVVVATKGR